jgi:hypothetical protein
MLAKHVFRSIMKEAQRKVNTELNLDEKRGLHSLFLTCSKHAFKPISKGGF